MSAPIDEEFYAGEMNGFACLQRFNAQGEDKSFVDIDPRLISGTNTPMSTDSGMESYNLGIPNHLLNGPTSDCDFALFSDPSMGHHPPTFFDPDLTMKFEPLRHQMLGHRRSVSVPPEDISAEQSQPPIVFHRGGTFLGDSLATPKSSSKRWLKKSSQKKSQNNHTRHSPYPSTAASPTQRLGMRRAQTQPNFAGPTSAPSMPMPYLHEEQNLAPTPAMTQFDVGQASSSQNTVTATKTILGVPTDLNDIDALSFGPRTNTNTAALGMLGFASRLMHDCETIRQFLHRGFKDTETDNELERIRQEKRAFNHTVISLADPLDTLPLPAAIDAANVPATGHQIRDLDVENTHALLTLYDIPFAADMFLHDKKLMYLRFVGASRVLMHAVLD